MRVIVCLAAAILTPSPASASGGFWCSADDASVKLGIESGLTRGMGNPLFGFKGELEIKSAGVADDLRRSVLTQDNLMQHWLDGKMLNLQLYRESAHGELTLTIETKAVDEGSYEGAYALQLVDMAGGADGAGKTLALDGKVSCSAE